MSRVEQLLSELKAAGVSEEIQGKLKTLVTEEKNESYQAGVGKAYENVDNTVMELFGTTKKDGEKIFSTDFLKNSFSMYKSSLEMDIEKKYKDIKAKNKELEEAMKNNDASKIEEIRTALNKRIEELESENSNIKVEFQKKEKMLEINNVFSKFQFEVNDPEYLDFKKKQVIEPLLDLPIVKVDGKTVLKGGEKQGHRDIVLEDFIQKEFSSLIKQTQSPDIKEPQIPIETKLKSVKTKDEFYSVTREMLESQGLKPTDKRWDTERTQILEQNKEILQTLE